MNSLSAVDHLERIIVRKKVPKLHLPYSIFHTRCKKDYILKVCWEKYALFNECVTRLSSYFLILNKRAKN